MKKILVLLTIGILLLSGPQTFAKTYQKAFDHSFFTKNETCSVFHDDRFMQYQNQYEKESILVKFEEGIDISTPQMVFKTINIIVNSDPSFGSVLTAKHAFSGLEMNTENKYLYGLDRWIKVTFENVDNLLEELYRWKNHPFVFNAQLNHRMAIYLEPNDPYYYSSGSWGQDFQDLYGMHLIDASGAWDVSTGSDNVVVAIVDTGVDYNHEDIIDNLWINEDEIPNNGYDDDSDGFVDNIYGADFSYNDGDPSDGHGHGTHCAGTVAGVGNNAIGVVGVNWQCKIMAVKGLDDTGSGDSLSLANALCWAADNGAQILSNSWGPWGGNPSDPILEAAVSYAYGQDCVVVFAAGNDNADVKEYSPANMNLTIAVAATDNNDIKATFSNWGELIDVSAPGVDILSLRAEGTDMYGDGEHIVDEDYYYSSGTSMACPHVAGLVALIRSIVPNFANYEVLERMISTTDDIYDFNPSYGGLLGIGRINASDALNIPDHNVGVRSIDTPCHIKFLQMLYINTTVFNNGLHRENDIIVSLRVDGTEIDTVIIPYFKRTHEDLCFEWMPPEVGVFNVTVNVTITGVTEDYYWDNEKSQEVIIGVLNFNTRECFKTIQEAIDDSDTIEGHTILAPQGIYYENVVLNKGVRVTGMYHSRDITIIDGYNNGNVVHIKDTSSASIMEFTLRNGVNGVVVESSSNSTIKNTVVINNDCGILLNDSSTTNILWNNITNNNQGFLIDSESIQNHIFYNRVNNNVNAFDYGFYNQWDNGYTNGFQPDGGNYWSDYACVDEFKGPDQDEPGSDGIGDTPYLISGGSSKDLYPLMEPPGALPKAIYVDDDNTEGPWDGSKVHPYQRVQDGVDNARSGDLVFIFNGHYIEPTIGIWYKQLSLVGENKFETIIECSKRVGYVNNVISICHSRGVVISDLTLQKSGNITGPWDESGIWFLNASNTTITGNIIRDCAYGIHMLHEHSNNITGNIFFNNSYRGIYIFQSNNNSVYENIFIENHDGIYIREAFDNIISGNKFSFNKYGDIHFTSGASDNFILDNTFTGNRDGVYINGASGNYIYHNNFLGNRDNAYDDSTNSWYDSYLSGGNFWIDYLGADNDDDGFGDIPYLIRGGINYDMYPLMDPWNNGSEPPLSLKITGQTAGKIGKEYEYTFNTVDPNNNEVYYWIDWGDGRQEKWIGPFNSGMDIKVKHRWNKEGMYIINAITMNTNYSTSPWVTLEVKMPRDKSISSSLLLRFLERYPLLNRLLNLVK